MKGRTPWFIVAIMLATLVACGGDGDDEPEAGDATPECKALTDRLCNRAIGCMVMIGTLTESERGESLATCINGVTAGARCEDAIAVRPSYQQCLAEIDAKPCSDWDVPHPEDVTLTPPSSCEGVILLP
ncbi:MAG TPA: hypothetical protein VM686_15245 [Polyangiaceae bacterium]|nr:hypothetical protein [Polyangiaceae bacterium]